MSQQTVIIPPAEKTHYNEELDKKFIQRTLSPAGNSLILGLALIGLIQLLAGVSGSEPIPPFRPLYSFRADLEPIRTQVLTTTIRNDDSDETHWQALQPALSLLDAIHPDSTR